MTYRPKMAIVASATSLLRHKLQELFTPTNERIVGLVGVFKPGKKRKQSYLVITVTVQQPQQGYIHRVKNVEGGKKGDPNPNPYKKVKTWNFSELKLVDGKSKQHGDATFSLHLDRTTFKWVAVNSAEKESFIASLWRQVPRFSSYQNIEFVNVDKDRLKELTHMSTSSLPGGTQVGREPSEEASEEYQELLPKEEEDLSEILTSHEGAIQDAEKLVERISEELSTLDEVSIETIIESEDQVQILMDKIQDSIVEVTLIEQNLNTFASLMDSVRSTIEKTDLQFRHVMIEDRNLFELRETLSVLVGKIDLDERSELLLKSAPLHRSDVEEVTRAALRLEEIFTEDIGNLSNMVAVQRQLKKYSAMKDAFCERVSAHLLEIFQKKSQQFVETVSRRGSTQSGALPSLLPHRELFNELVPYVELMKWMKRMSYDTFKYLCEMYCTMFSKVYDVEIKDFISDLRQRMMSKKGGKVDETSFQLSASAMNIGRSSGGVNKSMSTMSISSVGSGEGETPDVFFQVFVHVLDQIQPLCATEQEFCAQFFDCPQEEQTDGIFLLVDDMEVDGQALRKLPMPVVDISKFIGDALRGILSTLFQVLLPQIEQLMQFGERVDNFNSLSILVYISRRWMVMSEDRSAPTYLDSVLTNTLPFAKKLFEKFLQSKVAEINDSKPSKKKSKCGILPCVKIFAKFSQRAEMVILTSDRRHELDKAYKTIMEAVFKAVERCSMDHAKTPPDVIRFENYHHLFDILSKLKIPCLETNREDAKRSYKRYIEQYCRISLGRPLEKLSVFFEGVDRLLASNTRPEEVGYRVDFSKAVLRECIQKYPGKEVRKGLEKLYRKVEKDVSEEEGLLTVVWGYMQEAFINQVAQFNSLMKKCYPGANMTLLFSIAELQQYFVSIVNQEGER